MTQGHLSHWETGLLLVVAGVAVCAAACLSVSAPVGLTMTFRK
jgi:hypothetical protein